MLMLVNFLPIEVDSVSHSTFVSSCNNDLSDVVVLMSDVGEVVAELMSGLTA